MTRVIVVGGGVAGLASAYWLKRHGIEAVVCEAAGHVGGRMRTEAVDGWVMDAGAQFISRRYPLLTQWIEEMGLGDGLRPLSSSAALVHRGRIVRLAPGHPWTLWTKGVLGPRELYRLGLTRARLARWLRRHPPHAPETWAELDRVPGEEWVVHHLGQRVLRLYEPVVEAFWSQSLDQVSALIPALLTLSFGARHLTLQGGLGTLCESLAAELDVRLDTPVRQVRVVGSRVHVDTGQGEVVGDWTILATPAPVSARLLPEPSPEEQGVLSTEYSPYTMIGLLCNRRWNHIPGLEDVYMLLIPREERQMVTGLVLQSRSGRDVPRDGELLQVEVTGAVARDLLERPDPEVLETILPELERYVPSVSRSIVETRIVRWHHGLPVFGVGHVHQILRYRSTWSPQRRVLLAGDYMAMPHAEGAAQAGVWAAQQILDHVSGP